MGFAIFAHGHSESGLEHILEPLYIQVSAKARYLGYRSASRPKLGADEFKSPIFDCLPYPETHYLAKSEVGKTARDANIGYNILDANRLCCVRINEPIHSGNERCYW